MLLSEQQIDYIRDKVAQIKYGEVRIVINSSSRNLDIVVEDRVRFEKLDNENNYKRG